MQRAASGLAATCAQLLGGVYRSRIVLLVGSGDSGGRCALRRRATRTPRGTCGCAVGRQPHPRGWALRCAAAGGRVARDAAVVDRADLVIDGILGIGGRGGLRPPVDEVAGAGVGIRVRGGRRRRTQRRSTRRPAWSRVRGSSRRHGDVRDVEAQSARGPRRLAHRARRTRRHRPGAVPGRPDGRGAPERRCRGPAAGCQRGVGQVRPRRGGRCGRLGGVHRGSRPCTAVRLREAPGWCVTPGRRTRPRSSQPLAEGRARRGPRQAWVVGPGLGQEDDARDRLRDMLAQDASTRRRRWAEPDRRGPILARDPSRTPTLLTPHAGELARLLEVERVDAEETRLEHVRRAADDLGTTVLLKGSTTLVAAPGEGAIRVNATGTSGWRRQAAGRPVGGRRCLARRRPVPARRGLGGGLPPRIGRPHRLGGCATTAVAVLEAVPEAIRLVLRPSACVLSHRARAEVPRAAAYIELDAIRSNVARLHDARRPPP